MYKQNSSLTCRLPENKSSIFFGAALFILLLIGCENSNEPVIDNTELQSTELQELVSDISTDLHLTSAQEDSVRSIFARHQNRRHEAGFLWRIAAELRQRLTDEQKENLFALLRRYEEQPANNRRLMIFNNWPTLIGQGISNCSIQFTEAQLEEIKAIREAYAAMIEELRGSFRAGEITEDEFRQRVQRILSALNQEIRAIISDEQQRRYEACVGWKDELIEDVRDPAYRVMAAVLGLQEDQKVALINLKRNLQRAYSALISQLQMGELDRVEFVDSIKNYRDRSDARLREILNRRQYEIVLIHRALSTRLLINQFTQIHPEGDGF
jgi:uncharacterized membrane protein